MSKEAMKLALEAIEMLVRFESDSWELGSCRIAGRAITALREALAEQPAQRCPLCNYQHGHAIGCENNPVDIALAKMAEQPAQQEPVADKHQAFIDSLPSDMEDKMFEQVHYWARQSYARHQRSTRGQTITAADSSDNHIIWAALRWAKENAATPPAQHKPWVGLTEEEVQAAVYDENGCVVDYEDYASAIEAKLKEKNT